MDFLREFSIGDFIKYFYLDFGSPWDIIRAGIDISVVTYFCYKLIILLRDTRAWQLVKGIVVILVMSQVSNFIGLKAISYVLNNIITIAAIAIVILFQPELRKALEHLGRSKFSTLLSQDDQNSNIRITTVIEEIINACANMAKRYVGALIVIERDTKIGEIIDTGIQLDSRVNSEILINIFTPNTPLHDGAVIIRDNIIKAASCYLPLTDNPDLSKELGTRHRAAIGISEISDCIVIVVSEESGKISFALNGSLTRNLTSDILRKALAKNLLEEKNPTNKKINLRKGKTGERLVEKKSKH